MVPAVNRKATVKPAWQRAIIALSFVVTAALAFSALYWMRSLFIPIALAVFFTYVLSPLVEFLQRKGLGRVPSVLLVFVTALLLFLGGAALVIVQLAGMSETLADNKDAIRTKIETTRLSIVGNGESRWGKIFDELETAVGASRSQPAAEKQTLTIEPTKPSYVTQLETILGPAGDIFGMAAFSFILVVFMLLAKEDLQDRVLRLVGDGAVTSATRALREANSRVSDYLFTQLLLNSAFGLVCMIGLFLMEVQYALLFGFIAAVMRYVPYIGTWIGVLPPMLFSFAMSEGTGQPIGVFALYIGLEMICNNLIEPRLYGKSLGVSEVALLVSAAFWSFLWGPIGLILSGPITTCLVVIGKYIPAFRFLHVLLGTEPSLTPAVALYQRLVARKLDEALRVVEAATIKTDPAEAVFDTTVLPAFTLIKTAKLEGEFEEDEEKLVFAVAKDMTDDLIGDFAKLEAVKEEAATVAPVKEKIRLMCCPAADEWDQLSLASFVAVMTDDRWDTKLVGTAKLSSELLDEVAKFAPHVICIGSLPPSGDAHLRYLCKRLRSRFPDVHILVCRWGETETDATATALKDQGTIRVETTVVGARTYLTAWLPVFHHGSPEAQVKIAEKVNEFSSAGTTSA